MKALVLILSLSLSLSLTNIAYTADNEYRVCTMDDTSDCPSIPLILSFKLQIKKYVKLQKGLYIFVFETSATKDELADALEKANPNISLGFLPN